MDVISNFAARFERSREEELSLEDYLAECKRNPLAYATAAERMLKAIGEPEMVDTRNDPRLSRLFANKVIKIYPAFAEFYGMEDAIEQVVSLLPPRGAGPGGEEADPLPARPGRRRQELDRRAAEAADGARAVLRDQGLAGERVAARPVRPDRGRPDAREGVRHSAPLPAPASCRPWAVKRLEEYGGDIRKFQVVKRHPSRAASRSRISKTEPGDENNQDISSLVGKVDIRKLETYAQDDPDAYSYSGGLCLANQGLLEFVEMFKAPIKVLHPLLTATQEGNFKGTEGFGAIPFDGIVLAHSQRERVEDLPQQQEQRGLPRPHLHRQGAVLPARLRRGQDLREAAAQLVAGRGAVRPGHAQDDGAVRGADAAEGAGELVALFEDAGLRRREPEGHRPASAKSYQEYRDYAGVDEGMSGISTRFAFKILSKVFNFDQTEIAANPVHLMYVLEQQIEREQFPAETEQTLPRLHQGAPRAALRRVHRQGDPDRLPRVLQRVRPEHLRPLRHLRRLLDPGPGVPRHRHRRECSTARALNAELEKIEKPAGIANPKDFRNEIVNFVLRARANNNGKNPPWTQLREAARGDREEDVLEHRGAAAGDLLQRQGERRRGRRSTRTSSPAWSPRATPSKQVRLLCEWYLRVRKSARDRRERRPRAALHAMPDHRSPARRARTSASVNRERFLRRYKEQIREAVQRAVGERGIRDMEQGEDVHVPQADITEPVVRPRPRRRRARSCTGQPGVRERRPHRAAAGRRRRRRRQRQAGDPARARTTSSST